MAKFTIQYGNDNCVATIMDENLANKMFEQILNDSTIVDAQLCELKVIKQKMKPKENLPKRNRFFKVLASSGHYKNTWCLSIDGYGYWICPDGSVTVPNRILYTDEMIEEILKQKHWIEVENPINPDPKPIKQINHIRIFYVNHSKSVLFVKSYKEFNQIIYELGDKAHKGNIYYNNEIETFIHNKTWVELDSIKWENFRIFRDRCREELFFVNIKGEESFWLYPCGNRIPNTSIDPLLFAIHNIGRNEQVEITHIFIDK